MLFNNGEACHGNDEELVATVFPQEKEDSFYDEIENLLTGSDFRRLKSMIYSEINTYKTMTAD